MLPAPGSPAFIPSLLHHLQSEINGYSSEWSIDPSLFSALLLAQIASPVSGGVIVDVLPSEGKKKGVEKVVGNVVALTQGVYGFPTSNLRLDSHSHPSQVTHALLSGQQTPSRGKSTARTSTSPSSSRHHTPGLPTPLFPRSARTSRTPTPSITPRNSRPLLSPSKGKTDEYGFGPLLHPHPGYPDDNQNYASLDTDPGNSQNSQMPQCLVISGLERASSAVWIKLVDILLKGYIDVGGNKSSGAKGNEGDGGGREAGQGESGGDGREEGRRELPDGFWVIWVRDEDKSEDCYSWLIDQFSCSVTVHPDDLDYASDIPPRPLIPQTYISILRSLLSFTHISPPLVTHTSNLLSALSNHPRLHSSITGKVLCLFPDFVKAHRLLSAPFDVPEGWEEGLRRRENVLLGRMRGEKTSEKGDLGVGGGVGGVDTWGILAGEEPLISAIQQRSKLSINSSKGSGGLTDDTDEEKMEEWYCHPSNVHAVLNLCLRHRLSWREEREEVMWLLQGTARGHLGKVRQGEDNEDRRKKDKLRARRRRRGVDLIVEEIMASV